jgi:cellulose synthase/poly-beta-1,6-N-acetylglucosamine synthase-like glycosyltransferase
MDNLAARPVVMQLPYFPSEPLEQVLMAAYLLAFLIQMCYLWVVFRRLAFLKARDEKPGAGPVSVVICARNEYDNLKNNLPLILRQEYPDFEVVVVNDNSQDDSLELLNDMAREHSNLKVVNLSQDLNFFHGKKFPLSLGIKSAANEILLLTDADCRPASSHWISSMTSGFREGKEIVLGYGAYERRPSLLNYLIRFETLWVAIQYLSFSLAGHTYMGVGRNIAYRKSLFYRNKGFSSHYKLSSGDDDLFINRAASRNNVAVEVSHQSHTVSVPKTSFGAWMRQKRRHFTTWKHYRKKYKWLLGGWSGSTLAFMLLFAATMVSGYNLLVGGGIFAIRFFSHLLITKKSMIRLNEKELLLLSPMAEIFLIIIYPVLGLANMIRKPDKWK